MHVVTEGYSQCMWLTIPLPSFHYCANIYFTHELERLHFQRRSRSAASPVWPHVITMRPRAARKSSWKIDAVRLVPSFRSGGQDHRVPQLQSKLKFSRLPILQCKKAAAILGMMLLEHSVDSKRRERERESGLAKWRMPSIRY